MWKSLNMMNGYPFLSYDEKKIPYDIKGKINIGEKFTSETLHEGRNQGGTLSTLSISF